MAASALAQDKYPGKPVTVVVPQAAGGDNDAIARIVAQKLTNVTFPRKSLAVLKDPSRRTNVASGALLELVL